METRNHIIESGVPSPEEQEQKPHLPSQVEVVRDGSNRTTEVLVIEGENRVDLYKFLPPKVIFVADNNYDFRFAPGDPESIKHPPKVFFPPNDVDTVEGRLALLHEMGHSIKSARENYRPLPYDDFLRMISRIAMRVRGSEDFAHLSDSEKQGLIKSEYEASNSSKDLDEDGLTFAIQQLARDERIAWAEALKIYRQVKQTHGINMLGDARLEDLEAVINGALGSYERTYAMFTTEDQVKLFITNKMGK